MFNLHYGQKMILFMQKIVQKSYKKHNLHKKELPIFTHPNRTTFYKDFISI